MKLRDCRDLAKLRETATVLDVGHDDIHRPFAAERGEAFNAEQELTAGHALADPVLDRLGTDEVGWRHRLLIPRQLLRLESPSHGDREGDVEMAVHVDLEGDVRPDRLAHRLNTRDANFSGCINFSLSAVERWKSIERCGLDRPESVSDRLPCVGALVHNSIEG